jgi:hypothetical protein
MRPTNHEVTSTGYILLPKRRREPLKDKAPHFCGDTVTVQVYKTTKWTVQVYKTQAAKPHPLILGLSNYITTITTKNVVYKVYSHQGRINKFWAWS